MNRRPQNVRAASDHREARRRSRERTEVRALFAATLLLLFAVVVPAFSTRSEEEIGNEYRLTLAPHHQIKGDLTGFGQFEYRDNPEKDYRAFDVIWPGLTYRANHSLQFSGGLLTRYTDNEQSADKLELRPFAGVKVFVPNMIKWNLYNYTRYEFRDTENLKTHDWTSYSRLRSRFGVELPLTSREKAWQLKTWYGLADVEPIYRFDHDTIDPLYVRSGLGYVLNEQVRLEFIYSAQFTRPAGSSSPQYTENILQLNLKIGFDRGILHRLQNPSSNQ